MRVGTACSIRPKSSSAEEKRLRQLLIRVISRFVTDPQEQKELLGLVYPAGEHEFNHSLEGIVDAVVPGAEVAESAEG